MEQGDRPERPIDLQSIAILRDIATLLNAEDRVKIDRISIGYEYLTKGADGIASVPVRSTARIELRAIAHSMIMVTVSRGGWLGVIRFLLT